MAIPITTTLPQRITLKCPVKLDLCQSNVFFYAQTNALGDDTLHFKTPDYNMKLDKAIIEQLGLETSLQMNSHDPYLIEFLNCLKCGRKCSESNEFMQAYIFFRLSKYKVPQDLILQYLGITTISSPTAATLEFTPENLERFILLFVHQEHPRHMITILRNRFSLHHPRAVFLREFLISHVFGRLLDSNTKLAFQDILQLRYVDFAEKFVCGALTKSDLTLVEKCDSSEYTNVDRNVELLRRKVDALLRANGMLSDVDRRFIQFMTLPFGADDVAHPVMQLVDIFYSSCRDVQRATVDSDKGVLNKFGVVQTDEFQRYIASNFLRVTPSFLGTIDSSFGDLKNFVPAIIRSFTLMAPCNRLCVGRPIPLGVAFAPRNDFVIVFDAEYQGKLTQFIGVSMMPAAISVVELWTVNAGQLECIYHGADVNSMLTVVEDLKITPAEANLGFNSNLWKSPYQTRHCMPAFRVVKKKNKTSIQLFLNQTDESIPHPFGAKYSLKMSNIIGFELLPLDYSHLN